MLRRDTRVAPSELLAPEEPPALSADLRLQFELSVNGSASNTTATTRGAPVSFAGPEGSWVEAEPHLLDVDTLCVELRFYETGTDGRRLAGSTLLRPNSHFSSGAPDSARPDVMDARLSVLRGRKGYLLDLRVTATYL